MNACLDFALEKLVPAARRILLETHEAHHGGKDIGVSGKEDGSPASRADRETEREIRRLIAESFPGHGVWGEEFGRENTDREFVWVLDPLDGTREFLSGEGEWGSLIALMQNAKPVLGVVFDPLKDRIWSAVTPVSFSPLEKKTSESPVISCTNPQSMFAGTLYENGFRKMEKIATVKQKLNCIGYVYAGEGSIDAAVENELKIYDVAALLPVLWTLGAECRLFDGRDYRDHAFDLQNDRRYDLACARDPALMKKILSCFADERKREDSYA